MSNDLDTQNKEYQKKIFYDQDLSKYSWFNLGGVAEVLFKPDSIKQLKIFIEKNKKKKINIIGAGSNTLIRDGGVKGVLN